MRILKILFELILSPYLREIKFMKKYWKNDGN